MSFSGLLYEFEYGPRTGIWISQSSESPSQTVRRTKLRLLSPPAGVPRAQRRACTSTRRPSASYQYSSNAVPNGLCWMDDGWVALRQSAARSRSRSRSS